MDGLPGQVTLHFQTQKLASEIENPNSSADLYIRTSANFEIKVGDELLYSEPDFPVIELAVGLAHWSGLPLAGRLDFEFDSMSTAETGWVWIRGAGDGWRIGSLHQSRAFVTVWSEQEVQRVIDVFISDLVKSANECLGIDLGRLEPTLKR